MRSAGLSQRGEEPGGKRGIEVRPDASHGRLLGSLPALVAGTEPMAGGAPMKILELLRKGFGYVLLSMGVSSATKMSKPAPKAGPKPGSET